MKPRRIDWYRTPLERDVLARLTQKSNALASAQTFGHLALLAVLGSAFVVLSRSGRIALSVGAFFLYATVSAFTINGFHEFVHGTVFRTRSLNKVFAGFFALLFWGNPVQFRESHMRHHQFTLHPPDDLEVRLPVMFRAWDILVTGIVDIKLVGHVLWSTLMTAAGRIQGEWDETCFPDSDRARRRRLVAFARAVILFHAVVITASLLAGVWQVALLVSFSFPFGRWLHIACNFSQHAGLPEDEEDFRLNTRSVRLNPVVQFLYWHMNFHIEHHMYASVPCYRLAKLHRAIRHDLPRPESLIAMWRQVFPVLRLQREDPSVVIRPALPTAGDHS